PSRTTAAWRRRANRAVTPRGARRAWSSSAVWSLNRTGVAVCAVCMGPLRPEWGGWTHFIKLGVGPTSTTDHRSGDHLWRVRAGAQAGFGEADPRVVVEEDAVLVAGPQGVGPHLPRPLHLEEKAARPPGPGDEPLVERRLLRVQLVVLAQDFSTCR